VARQFDVCNGDADGLCALVQWRLHHPGAATLVTGLKREITLLARAEADALAGDEVHVFDLSMQRNQAALTHLLAKGVRVVYFDHHASGEVPAHPLLQAHIDLGADTCTSLLVDAALGGRYRGWALVGAYGDNLASVADQLAAASGWASDECQALRRLGELINYNAYGETEADVCVQPARLFGILAAYPDPRDLLRHEPIIEAIAAQRQFDEIEASAIVPFEQNARGCIHVLPDAPWSRRLQGSLANELANADPLRAQAVLKQRGDGAYVVSVRAPLCKPAGASALCARFGGNGRARAAGIDVLPEAMVPQFVASFLAAPWGDGSVG
jgi:hypothetical protein